MEEIGVGEGIIEEILEEEIKRVIKGMKSRRRSGVIGDLLKRVGIVGELIRVFRSIVNEGEIFKNWKDSVIFNL